MRRIISVFAALLLIMSIYADLAHIYAAEQEVVFNFSDAVSYGGTAADDGERIYYADPDNNNALTVRLYGSRFSAVICQMPASSINISGGRIYFISDGGIWACCTDGSGLSKLYSDDGLSCLYVDGNYAYFLKGKAVYRLRGRDAVKLFEDERIRAFKPITSYCIEWYADDPDYYVEDCGGASTDSEYLKYRYDISEGVSKLVKEEITETTTDYSGPYVTVGNATLPLAEHMPGTYFSKNGQACTCHSRPDCVSNPPECNCMRFYPTGDADTCEIDLLGCQCFGFSRLVFYKCFGFIDHDTVNPGMSYSVGSIARGSVTASTVKELLMKCKPGAHVRLSFGHSFSILEMDDDGITIYHGNAGGDGVIASPCIVSTRYMTWQALASWAAAGIAYVRMPTDYPGYETISQPKVPGWYVTDNLLNIRSGAGTEFDKTGKQYASGTLVYVDEVVDNGAKSENNWGKTDLGWLCLDYCTFITDGTLSLAADSGFKQTKDRYVFSDDASTVGALIKAAKGSYFSVRSADGTRLGNDEALPTGAVLTIEYGTKTLYQFPVVLMGDINCNARVDIGDYLMLKRTYYGSLKLDGAALVAADLTQNGEVGADDWALMKRRFS